MTKQEFKRQIKTLLIGVEDNIEQRVNHLLLARVFDISTFDPEDFSLAKAVLYNCLKEAADGLRPLSPEAQVILKNLEHF